MKYFHHLDSNHYQRTIHNPKWKVISLNPSFEHSPFSSFLMLFSLPFRFISIDSKFPIEGSSLFESLNGGPYLKDNSFFTFG